MIKFPYVIIGVVIATIVVNIRMCNASELLVMAPYMQTQTAQVINNIHYARTVCDDVVLRADDFCCEQDYSTMVDICIARLMVVLSDIFSCKRAQKEFIADDLMYIEAIMHSMVSDLKETQISPQQEKTLSFVAVLFRALLFT